MRKGETSMKQLFKDPIRDMAITALLAYLITFSGWFEFDKVSQAIATLAGMALAVMATIIWAEERSGQ